MCYPIFIGFQILALQSHNPLTSSSQYTHTHIHTLKNIYIYLLIWQHWVLFAAMRCSIFIPACGFFSCGIQDFQLQDATTQLGRVASSSLTRDRTCTPCIGSAVLTTGPPGKSPKTHFNPFLLHCCNSFISLTYSIIFLIKVFILTSRR